MRRLIYGISALLLCLFVIIFYGKYTYSSSGPLGNAENVVIAKGNVTTILAQLQREKIISSSYWSGLVFRSSVQLTHQSGQLHAAEFFFPKQVSIKQVLDILRHAKPVQHKLTIPEGLTAFQIASLVNKAPYMTGQVKPPEEGTVLPQTYAYEWGMSREKFMFHTQQAMQKKLQQIWDNREVITKVETQQDLVTLASIVEKETALKRERPMIARVFINRLQLGMKLQSDPTVAYVLSDGKGDLDRPLTRRDWEVVNPYNTYWTDALPPTPICSPGEAAMEAVAHPAKGKILYFVANGTGGHSFSTSLAEHNHNVSLNKKRQQ